MCGATRPGNGKIVTFVVLIANAARKQIIAKMERKQIVAVCVRLSHRYRVRGRPCHYAVLRPVMLNITTNATTPMIRKSLFTESALVALYARKYILQFRPNFIVFIKIISSLASQLLCLLSCLNTPGDTSILARFTIPVACCRQMTADNAR